MALRSTQSPVQLVLRALYPVVQWLECEADHSPPSSGKIKNVWSYTSTPSIPFQGMVLN
jgi:hypothetical protein